jgi:hypothetical protein
MRHPGYAYSVTVRPARLPAPLQGAPRGDRFPDIAPFR